MSIRKK